MNKTFIYIAVAAGFISAVLMGAHIIGHGEPTVQQLHMRSELANCQSGDILETSSNELYLVYGCKSGVLIVRNPLLSFNRKHNSLEEASLCYTQIVKQSDNQYPEYCMRIVKKLSSAPKHKL